MKQIHASDQIENLIDNIGLPLSGINLSLSEGALISAADAQKRSTRTTTGSSSL